jgi:hypothetical protein
MNVARTSCALGAALSLVCACASGRRGFATEEPAPAASSGAPPTPSLGPPADAGQAPQAVLYAHTDTTLFRGDPAHLDAPLVRVGDFDCIGEGTGPMTDLAVTKDGALFGVSEGAAYPLTIDPCGTVHCEATWKLPRTKFYGLTVAPEGTVGAREVLIGADSEGGLYEIDEGSGSTTEVGTLGVDPSSGEPWSLSGDIVFMANAGQPVGFATVRTCMGTVCQGWDTLIEVDVKAIAPGTQSVLKSIRGAVMRGSWCTTASEPFFGSLFGVAAYEDKVVGFSRIGEIIEIHSDDGTACLVASDPANAFAGAGIATSAPVVAPPPVR